MNLQSSIDERVWTAVSSSYESGEYAAAISDAFYFLSDLIRSKSGLDSDGAALVGTAFGGDKPVIKVNAFQTETDKSEQKGIEQVLRGLYLGFRNPRSHEKRTDTPATADAVISFISFLSGLIDRSKSPFDIEQIAQQVFDKHFVASSAYATAIASRIPTGKRFDVLIEIFNRRMSGKTEHVTHFCRALLLMVPQDSQAEFWQIVSEALEGAASDAEVRTAVSVAGANWENLSDVARLRTENRLIASISEGEYDPDTKSCPKGSLGTWASGIANYFLSQEQFRRALIERIETGDSSAIEYVLRYFKSSIFKFNEPLDWDLEWALSARLSADDQLIFDALMFMESTDTHESWLAGLKESLDSFKKRNPGQGISDDDIPF
jgi:uncharacterized protein (TIGR02391 family)